MVSPGRHPKNAINAALKELPRDRFDVVELHQGHAWGYIVCLVCGQRHRLWSTPRVPEDNASSLRHFARRHDHGPGPTEEG